MQDTINISVESSTIIRILLLSSCTFLLTTLITPLYTNIAYKLQLWKKQRTDAWSGGEAKVYAKLHAEKHKRNIPTMAGVVFVSAITIVTILANLDRSETWLPLAGMVGSGIIGFIDDWLNIRSNGKGIAGMRSKLKFGMHSLVALVQL